MTEAEKAGRKMGKKGAKPAASGDDAAASAGSAQKLKAFHDGKYNGEVKQGKREGKGSHVYTWGGTYDGEWKNDKRHGKGKLSDKWGGDYDGEWVNDKKEGRGVNLWSNGRRYEGQWKADEMSGEGRWRWADGRTYQGKFAADCPTEGLLMEEDQVYKVKYTGKTDIADPDLKPTSKEKDSSEEGKAFQKAATAWEARLNAEHNIDAVRAKTKAARDAIGKIKKDDEAAQLAKGRAAKDAEETEKLSSLAAKEAADALKTAEDLEKKAKEAREKSNKLAKLAEERAATAKKSAAEATKANKNAEENTKAKSDAVKELVELEKSLKSMEKILAEAQPTPNICDEGGTDTGARVDSTAKKGASAKTAESSSEPIAIIKAAGSVSKSATKKQSGGKSDGRLVKVDMCVTGEGSVACSITLRGK